MATPEQEIAAREAAIRLIEARIHRIERAITRLQLKTPPGWKQSMAIYDQQIAVDRAEVVEVNRQIFTIVTAVAEAAAEEYRREPQGTSREILRYRKGQLHINSARIAELRRESAGLIAMRRRPKNWHVTLTAYGAELNLLNNSLPWLRAEIKRLEDIIRAGG